MISYDFNPVFQLFKTNLSNNRFSNLISIYSDEHSAKEPQKPPTSSHQKKKRAENVNFGPLSQKVHVCVHALLESVGVESKST